MDDQTRMLQTIDAIIHSNDTPYLTGPEQAMKWGSSLTLLTSASGSALFEMHVQPARRWINQNARWFISNGFAHGIAVTAGFWWGYEIAGKYTSDETKKVAWGMAGGILTDIVVELGEAALKTGYQVMQSPDINFMQLYRTELLKNGDFMGDFGSGVIVALVLIPSTYALAKTINYYRRVLGNPANT
ncbi:MAG: hypothetical protein ABIJ34_09210 [archaeon]